MTAPLEIRVDDLCGPEVAALLQGHLDSMAVYSPAECVHALDLTGLRAPNVTFWAVWQGDTLAGCGALKELDATHGEIKSMRTAITHLRQGVGAAMLEHIINVAQHRGYHRLSLETGSGAAFEPAHALYSKFGFERCDAFADYIADSFSVFMSLELAAS